MLHGNGDATTTIGRLKSIQKFQETRRKRNRMYNKTMRTDNAKEYISEQFKKFIEEGGHRETTYH